MNDRHNDILVLIPARFASSRFPGKPLVKIQNKSLIQRVFENLKSCDRLEPWVVTDHSDIENEVLRFGGKVIRVDDEVLTGTERIGLAYKRFFNDKGYRLVINVQGDEPLVTAGLIERLVKFHENSQYDIATMLKRRNKNELFESPHCVKVAYSPETQKCHYFSRLPIPRAKQGQQFHWFHHIGVYSYRPSSLIKFIESSPSFLEKQEELEQLRALERGMTIGAIEVEEELLGVDTPEDIVRIEGVLSGSANQK